MSQLIRAGVRKTGDTMTGDLIVPDEAYGSSWNGSLEVPTKNAVYDKVESLGDLYVNTTGDQENILGDKDFQGYINFAAGSTYADNVQMNSNIINGLAAPILADDAANKDYVDTTIASVASDTLFDHFSDAGNVGTGEDDLYSDTIAANKLSANGQKITAQYAGIFVSSATATRRLRTYFGGTLIYDSSALSLSTSADWDMSVMIIRESSTVVRCSVKVNTTTASSAPYTTYTRVTGLTLSGTNVLKITGEAAGVGAADNDLVAKLGFVEFRPAS